MDKSQCTPHPQTTGIIPAARINSVIRLCSTAAFNHEDYEILALDFVRPRFRKIRNDTPKLVIAQAA